MFQTLLNMLFGDSQSSYPSRKDITSAAPDVNKESATENEMLSTAENSPELTLDEEILLLARAHGPIGSGVKIELDLHEALKLFPRQRKRVDAYNKLIRKVREEYGTELIITSRKTKKP